MGLLVPLGDLLADIVERLLRRRSPRARLLSWRARFLVLLRQRAALLFAQPGKVGHSKNGERGTQAVEPESDSTPWGSSATPHAFPGAGRPCAAIASRRQRRWIARTGTTQARDQVVDLTEPPVRPAVNVRVPQVA
jgi:hypothetical protein